MKYLNVFDDKSVLNSSVASINHGNGAFVFGVKTKQGIEYVTIYDQRHPGGNCVRLGSVNMKPVRLDSLPTNKVNIGDVLYSTADGRLTFEEQTDGATNIPIAIFVTYAYENFENGDDYGNGFMTARFVSLNYMDCNAPTTGNKDPQAMYFGNNGTTIGNVAGNVAGGTDEAPEAPEGPKTPYIGGIDETLNIGGKWNTQQCLSKATKQDQNICDGVTNNSGTGYCAPACCCVAYSTPGTKPGDWYLPMPGELYQIYANKTAINEKRKAIKGSGFSDGGYWSSREDSQSQSMPSSLEYASKSREDSSIGEYSVNLSDGSIHSYNKGNSNYVLAFLAVAPPEQTGQPEGPGRPGGPEEA